MSDSEEYANNILDTLYEKITSCESILDYLFGYEDEAGEWHEGTEIYGVQWTIDDNFEFISASVCIAVGGPNIYLDTRDGTLELYWAGTEITRYLPEDTKEELEETFEEEYIERSERR